MIPSWASDDKLDVVRCPYACVCGRLRGDCGACIVCAEKLDEPLRWSDVGDGGAAVELALGE